ncbi:tetratricopeptide repeat protein [Flavobacterium alkalisoli]|uniref:tetratricopeptide repeat-containing sensor histidine kinase n=1 Tax=Flavobacterium alkalisoli TaxID=2602769 RepID=UPI003A907FAD
MQKTLLFAVVLLCVLPSPAQTTTASSFMHKGEQAFEQKNYTAAIMAFMQSVDHAKKSKDTLTLINSYNYLGSVYTMADQPREALDYYLQSLSLHKQQGNYKSIAETAKQVAVLYTSANEYDAAIQYYKEAQQYAILAKSPNIEAGSLGGLGMVYEKQQKYDMALSVYRRAIRIYETNNDMLGKAVLLSAMGNVYNHTGYYNLAEQNYKEALGYFNEGDERKKVAETLNDLGETFAGAGDYTESLKLHKQAYLDAVEIKYDEAVVDACKGLYKAYEHLEEYENTILYQKLYEQKRDSLEARLALQENAKAQMRYETQKAKSQMEILALTEKINKLEAGNRSALLNDKYSLIAISGGFAVMSSFLIFVWFQKARLKKKYKKQVARMASQRRKQNEKLTRVKELYTHLDNRLGEVYYLNEELSRKSVGAPSIRASNDALHNVTVKIHEDISDLVWALERENASPQNLANGMCDFASGYLKNHHVESVFSVDPDMPEVKMSGSARKELAIVLKECLNAIAVKAKANKVFLGISAKDDKMQITVRDNGSGNYVDYNDGKLKSLYKRLKNIGGETFVESLPGWGTTITISTPFESFEEEI